MPPQARPEIRRVDPEGCGCVDCIVGYSLPVDLINGMQAVLVCQGLIRNASGREFTPEIHIRAVAPGQPDLTWSPTL